MFTYDPKKPLMNWGGRNLIWPAGPRNQLIQDLAEQNIIWTGEAAAEPVKIAGKVEAELYFSSDRVDTDLMVRLEDVYPGSRAYLINDGALNLRFREGREVETLMIPGEIYRANVNLGNIAYVLEPGHALRIGISSSLFPRYEKNYNTGEPFTLQTDTLIAHNTIFTDRAHPSALILPVIKQNTGVAAMDDALPEAFILYQNYPNPFNAETTLSYLCSAGCLVNLTIYNLRGESVAQLVNAYQKPGMHRVVWDGAEHSSGIYLASLHIGSETKVIKCMLVK